MNIKPICISYNINRKFGYNATEAITIEHEEDFKTRFIDLFLYENNIKNAVDVSGATVTARMVTTPEFDSLLLNDNVSCSIGEKQGHIVVPIDKAVLPSYPCDFLVEVHIQNGENVLVLPFPLYVQIRGSILDNAGVAPESRGTIPELLSNAENALTAAQETIETFPIVSANVNVNGTITFTQRGGGTITTTGASVIGPQGDPGQDYVLTNQDKSDIADIVLGELPTTQGVQYGN